MNIRLVLALLPLSAILAAVQGLAQRAPVIDSADEAQRAFNEARAQGEVARRRAEALEVSARDAGDAVDRTTQEGAAIAARVQEAEARIAANEARITLIERQRAVLRAVLAQKQRPLVELTAALQRLSRRPPALSLLYPGSLSEAVYLRASLETLLPEVQRRTQGLRADLDRARGLQKQMRTANLDLRTSQVDLNRRRSDLTVLESRQRLASRSASGAADREAERALALAETARDLSGLVGELGKAGQLRDELAALPGPVIRPLQPGNASVGTSVAPLAQPSQAPLRYLLPVTGRLVAGFGDRGSDGRAPSRGIAIAARGSAQAIAPAAGRIAFAGNYQGYGNIVIIEHGGGWNSLVTGLFRLTTRVGTQVVAGSPLGEAGPGRPVLSLELRRDGQPVNPLDYYKP